jgi:hypothetical protein
MISAKFGIEAPTCALADAYAKIVRKKILPIGTIRKGLALRFTDLTYSPQSEKFFA